MEKLTIVKVGGKIVEESESLQILLNDFSHIQVPRIQLGTQPNGAFLMRAKGRG